MARVFLDTNILIDTLHRSPEKEILESLQNHSVYISVLSIHIYCYSFRVEIPNKKILAQKEKFQVIDFSSGLLEKALLGPTNDFEDNVQLHSCAEADCDYFLTSDKKLLNLKFFGKTQLISGISLS